MVTFVFDSSAVVRYLDREAGSDRVRQILKDCAGGNAEIVISAVQWGEVARIVGKRHGAPAVSEVLSRLVKLGFRALPVSAHDAVRAAMLQNALKLPYADAFVILLAEQHQHSVILTADYDFKLADHLTTIEFLSPHL